MQRNGTMRGTKNGATTNNKKWERIYDLDSFIRSWKIPFWEQEPRLFYFSGKRV